MIQRFAVCFALVCGFAVCQTRPANPHITNIDLADGEEGQLPPGWNVPPTVLDAGYRIQLQHQNCGGEFTTCVTYLGPAVVGKVKAGELQQTFPAAPYIGKQIRFSAWLKMDGADHEGYLHLRMRIDHSDGKVTFFDHPAPPVNGSEWQRREVFGEVSSDAVSISIWARYHPSGLAWLAAPSFGIVDQPWFEKHDDRAVRALMERFAAFRNSHDGAAVAALYSEDGQWLNPAGTTARRGRKELAELWNGVTGQVTRIIASVDFPAPNIAVVRVITLYPARRHEVMTILKDTSGVWQIYTHQSL